MPSWAGVAVAVLIPAIGIAVAWGALGQRLRQLEVLPSKVDALAERLAALDARTADSARSQGERIARAQTDVDKLSGEVKGLDRGFAMASRRSRTAAEGHPTGGKG